MSLLESWPLLFIITFTLTFGIHTLQILLSMLLIKATSQVLIQQCWLKSENILFSYGILKASTIINVYNDIRLHEFSPRNSFYNKKLF